MPASLLLLLACSSHAMFYDAGATYGFGSDSYQSVTGFAQVETEDGWSLRPSYSASSSDGSEITRVYQGKAGYDHGPWRVGVEGSVSPESNQYRSHSFGGELTAYFGGKKKEEKSLRGDLTAGALRTSHSQDFPLLSRAAELEQTEAYISGGLRGFDLSASGELRYSFYDHGVPSGRRVAALVRRRGINTSIFSVPEFTSAGELAYKGLPFVAPFAGFTFTRYEIPLPDSRSYLAGLRAEVVDIVELSFSYENYDSGSGAARSEYFTFGLTARY